MKQSIANLNDAVGQIENLFTRSLGFELPDTLNMEEALILLRGIEDPLKTSITEQLMTCNYVLDDYDVRWNVLYPLVKFSVRTGKLKPAVQELTCLFEDVIDKLTNKLHALLNEPERVPVTRFGYLKSCTVGFALGLTEDNRTRDRMVTKENFIGLFERDAERWVGSNGHFTRLSDIIIDYGKNYLMYDDCGYPRCMRDVRYIQSAEDLKRMKETLLNKVKLISVFNDILDDF